MPGLVLPDFNFTDEQLVQQVKHKSEKAFEILAVRYLKNIGFIARKFSVDGYEWNDFIQEGLISLLIACRSFDFNGKASFKSYADTVIENRFISIVRKFNTKKCVPGSEIIRFDDEPINLADNSKNPEDWLVCKDQLMSVIVNLKTILTQTEYKVLALYCSGLSYKQISQKLNITAKSADNALQRARRKIVRHNMCP